MRLPIFHFFGSAADIIRTLLILLSISTALVFAAPPTPTDEEKMAGKWLVNGGDVPRLYEITAGRNIRIEGGGRNDRRGRLTPQPDGWCLVKLDDDSILRMKYTAATDVLDVEFYRAKKELEKGLPPMWKTQGQRKEK
jgi:hypothetical protein